MPEEDEIIEQSSESQPEPQPQPASQEQQEAAQQESLRLAEEIKAAREAELKRNRSLVTLLTTLILICLVAEVVLASYIGLNLYRNSQNRQLLLAQYERYLEQQTQAMENPPKVQYIGPTVRVVDGVLVDNAAAAQAARTRAEGSIPGI